MSIGDRPVVLRCAAVVAALLTTASALPASASTLSPRPPRRAVDLSQSAFPCALSELDTVNVRLDGVAAPTRSTVVVAGRAPAGGSRAWALTPWGRDSASWSAAEPGAVQLDTAPDGDTVLAGATGIVTYRRSTWTRSAYPVGTAPSPVRSLAALAGGQAVVLRGDGVVRFRSTSSGSPAWRTLPAVPGAPLAVGAIDSAPALLSVEQVGAAQRFTVRRWAATRWTNQRVVVVAGAPAAGAATSVWAPRADGGVLAVNSARGLEAIIDLAEAQLVPYGALTVRSAVTGAEPVTGGRVLLSHGSKTAGSLSVWNGTFQRAVPGTAGGPVTSLERTASAVAGGPPGIVVLRSLLVDGEPATRIEVCG